MATKPELPTLRGNKLGMLPHVASRFCGYEPLLSVKYKITAMAVTVFFLEAVVVRLTYSVRKRLKLPRTITLYDLRLCE
jgi:hypothetical protein